MAERQEFDEHQVHIHGRTSNFPETSSSYPLTSSYVTPWWINFTYMSQSSFCGFSSSKWETAILWIPVKCKGGPCWPHRGSLPHPDITSQWQTSCHPLPEKNTDLEGGERLCFRERFFISPQHEYLIQFGEWQEKTGKSLVVNCNPTHVIPILLFFNRPASLKNTFSSS